MTLVDRFHNFVRDASLPVQEQRERAQARAGLEVIKVAAVVAAVTSIVFFALIPKMITAILALGIAFCAREAIVMARNAQEIFDTAAIENKCRGSNKELRLQLTKDTYVAASIGEILIAPEEIN